MPNNGLLNETNIIKALNNKKFSEINSNLQHFLIYIFGDIVKRNNVFYASKPNLGQIKGDIRIAYDDLVKLVSVKIGSGNSVHQERCEDFFTFLKKYYYADIVNLVKKFHYGDGTIDGTGRTRLTAAQCRKEYANDIIKINNAFNKNDNLKLFLNRFLFVGNVSKGTKVDAVYYGTPEKGIWASTDKIIKYITTNHFNKNGIHFGPLTYQVWNRDPNRTAKYPNRRYVMQVKWASIVEDLKKIK